MIYQKERAYSNVGSFTLVPIHDIKSSIGTLNIFKVSSNHILYSSLSINHQQAADSFCFSPV